MPLPGAFARWEHLQSVVMQTYNRDVREEFSDIGGEDWDENITTSRASLRVAYTVRDQDSALEVMIRMMLFYFTVGRAQALQTPIYGIPAEEYQRQVQFRPQIMLFFSQDAGSVPEGASPTSAEISFRLMNETSETINPAEALALGNKVKTVFGASGGYRWRKGRVKVSYRDLQRGYRLLLWAYSESEAREVIGKVLDIQGHPFDDDFLTVSETRKEYPTQPGTQFIYGKTRRKYTEKPISYVRFRYAALHIHGIPQGIPIYDATGRFRTALVR